MVNYSLIIGIDVSKDQLDLFELLEGVALSNKLYAIKNTHQDITLWLEKICSRVAQDTILCVLEPTGCYSQRLVHLLGQAGIATALVNPSQSHGFAQVLNITSKNDAQAARMLATMGVRLDLPLYQPISETMQQRNQLQMAIRALQKQRQMLGNQLHAFEHQIVFAPQAVQALKASLETVEAQLQDLQEQLLELDDEEEQRQLNLMQSVVGIGPKTAQAFLSATGGLHLFKTSGQLAKFIGIAPTSHQSGSSVYKKPRITKKGDTKLRANLYMATRTAKKYNHSCRILYTRLRQAGKCHKVAMVAVMHKLIKQAFGVVRSNTPFDNDYYLRFQ